MIKSISNYFSAKGRMCRQAFIIQYLAWLFFFALTMGASSLTTEKTLLLSFTHIFLTHSFLFLLALILYPLIVKRLHDRGKSSLFFLLIYVPIINIALVLYLLFSKGQIGPNKYGENPCEPTAKDRELIEDKSEGTTSIITLLIHIILITAVFLYSTIQTIDKIPLANEKPINFTTENI